LEEKDAAAPERELVPAEDMPRDHCDDVYSPGPGVFFMLLGTPGAGRLALELNGVCLS